MLAAKLKSKMGKGQVSHPALAAAVLLVMEDGEFVLAPADCVYGLFNQQ